MITAISPTDFEKASVEWLVMMSAHSKQAVAELKRRAAMLKSKPAAKHLAGMHDQDDHGNWATGPTPPFAAGKWTSIEYPGAYQARIFKGVADYATAIGKDPNTFVNAVRQYQDKMLQSGVNTTANGNVVYRSPSDRIVSMQENKGGQYDEQEWLKRIEKQMEKMPEVAKSGRFPIDVSWKNPGSGVLGKWNQSWLPSAGENAGIAAGGVLQFSPTLLSSEGLTSTEPQVTEAGTVYGYAVAGVPYADYTVTHEFGHIYSAAMAVEENTTPDTRIMNLRIGMRSAGLPTTANSDYGKETPGEWYAEFYAAYQYGSNDPQTLWLAEKEGWKR